MSLAKACLSPDKLKDFDLLKGLSKYFEIDLTIKVFGLTFIKFHWPPKISK